MTLQRALIAAYLLLLADTIWFAYSIRPANFVPAGESFPSPPQMVAVELPASMEELRGTLHAGDDKLFAASLAKVRANLDADWLFKFLYPLALSVFALRMRQLAVRAKPLATVLAALAIAAAITACYFDALENQRTLDNLALLEKDPWQVIPLDAMMQASLAKWGSLGVVLMLAALLESLTAAKALAASGWTSFRVCAHFTGGAVGVWGAVYALRETFTLESLGFTLASLTVLLEPAIAWILDWWRSRTHRLES